MTQNSELKIKRLNRDNLSVTEGLKLLTTKILELKQIIVDNPNYKELNKKLDEELYELYCLDYDELFFDEVLKKFVD